MRNEYLGEWDAMAKSKIKEIDEAIAILQRLRDSYSLMSSPEGLRKNDADKSVGFGKGDFRQIKWRNEE